MDQEEQSAIFREEIWNTINRYNEEFDLDFSALIGSLNIIVFQMMHSVTAYHEGDDKEY